MPPRIALTFFLPAALGCGSLWRDVPKPPRADPKVHFDAAWMSQDSSPEAIARAAQQRRQQVEKTVADRTAGNVGVPLDQAITSGGAAGISPASSQPASSQPAMTADVPPRGGGQHDTPSRSEGRHDTPPRSEGLPGAAPTDPASRQGKIVIEVAGGGTFVR